MKSIYAIGIILSLLISLIGGFTLYRLTTTIINANIDSTDYTTTPGKCILTIVYIVNGSKLTSKLTTPSNIQWTVGSSIPIYINPLDLSQPKYAPSLIYTILYIVTTIGFIGLLLSVYETVSSADKGGGSGKIIVESKK